ncbi:dihydroxyacetone kinase subunit L, partial [Klebsiella pneumoniae]|nr:dihydroxyacetone kinase subunit L [Klebsiella pneumoniae]
PTLFALIGERLTVVMGGSSGVLMSIFFTAAGQKLGQGASVAEALNAGLEQMKFYGGADEGDRTMIDALQPALAALLAEPENLQAAFAAAQAGADRTCQSSKAGAGRASYLNSDSLLGNMDPGAHAVAMVFKALAER